MCLTLLYTTCRWHQNIAGSSLPPVSDTGLQGGELFDRIMKKKSFTEQEASAVMRQVDSRIICLCNTNILNQGCGSYSATTQPKHCTSVCQQILDRAHC